MAAPYRTVAITGASSGIGYEMAKQFAAMGCQVGLMARREGPVQELAEKIEADGGRAVAVATDVTKREDVVAAFASIREELGPIDLVVANAGTGFPVKAENFDAEKAAWLYMVNVIGVLNCLEAALPEMIRARRGHIVGISSLAAYRSFPESHVYCASKAALNAQLEGLRAEVWRFGVHVTTICPGFIRTPLTDKNEFKMPFLLEPEDAVERMIRAIVRKKKVYNFPLPLYWLSLMTRWIPDRLLSQMTAGKSYKQS